MTIIHNIDVSQTSQENYLLLLIPFLSLEAKKRLCDHFKVVIDNDLDLVLYLGQKIRDGKIEANLTLKTIK